MLNIGFIGCGDVAFRSYFPAMAAVAGQAQVVACADPQAARAERAAALFPGAKAYDRYETLLGQAGLEAVFNLTPAPMHFDVTTAALDVGLHVFSEKPLAATVADARELIAHAKRRGRLLLCAPAVTATPRFVWLREVLAEGRIGRPILATGQMANMGPAAWRGYTGDPTVFYGPDVGPLLDTGVYVLHGVTGLFGPARRVQAFGGIAIPRRTVLAGDFAGRSIEVAANDLMLLHLDFGENRFAQILSSFAVPGSQAPAMEIHGTTGSISIGMAKWYNGAGPVDVLVRDESALGLEGWLRDVGPPLGPGSEFLIGAGPRHFVACLRGDEEPILTAEHACHVLEIILKAGESARDGRALPLETSF